VTIPSSHMMKRMTNRVQSIVPPLYISLHVESQILL